MDISGWVTGLWSQIQDLMNTILIFVMSGLPDSPFTMLQASPTISRYLRYLNYFVPINFMISVLESWLVAVAIFYVWQVLLRWTKAIE